VTKPKVQRVLVVDDSHDAANSLVVLLEVLGLQAEPAYDGPSALELAAEFRPELVLLDLTMPGMDGFAVARELRAREGGADLTIIALTGFGQSDFLRATREAGFDSHLTKPSSAAELSKLLQL
jgi:CheY-like chemotaxis protein